MDLATALNNLSLSNESIPEEPSISSFFKQIFQRGSDNLDAIGASAPIAMVFCSFIDHSWNQCLHLNRYLG